MRPFYVILLLKFIDVNVNGSIIKRYNVKQKYKKK